MIFTASARLFGPTGWLRAGVSAAIAAMSRAIRRIDISPAQTARSTAALNISADPASVEPYPARKIVKVAE
jgi:hypothetical protein